MTSKKKGLVPQNHNDGKISGKSAIFKAVSKYICNPFRMRFKANSNACRLNARRLLACNMETADSNKIQTI